MLQVRRSQIHLHAVDELFCVAKIRGTDFVQIGIVMPSFIFLDDKTGLPLGSHVSHQIIKFTASENTA